MRDYSELRAKAQAARDGAAGLTNEFLAFSDEATPDAVLAMLDEIDAARAKKPRAARAPKIITHDDSLFHDVDSQVAADFKTMRTRQRASITPTAMAGINREAAKAGMTLEQALIVCCERNWRGFRAEWIDRTTPVARQSANNEAKRRLFGGFDEFGITDAPG